MKRFLLFAFLAFFVSALSFGQLSEGFETWPPADWTIVQGPCSPTNDITQSSSQANSGTYSARFSSFSSCGSGYDEYLITPQLVTTGGDQTISFWYRRYSYGSEVFKVGWSSTGTDVNNDFTWGSEISDASTSWQQYFKTDLPVGTKYVAIHYYSNYAYYLYIDDVAGPAVYVPSCPAPTVQTENNITSSSVDLGWTTGGSDQWQIEYGISGFTQGTGTFVVTSDNPFPLSGLTAATDYDWYVRDICGAGDSSSWVGPSSFTTACETATTLSEGFSSSSTPACWDNSGTESWKFNTSADYGAASAGDHTTGGGTNYAWIDGSGGVGTNALITPLIDLSSFTTPAFEFYYFSNNTNNPGDNNTLTVSFYDGAGWNTLLTYAGDDAAWQQGLFDLSGYTITGDVQFRFVVTGTASTTYYNDILVDDVSVKEMPTCPSSGGLTVSEITTTTARLFWNPATGAIGYDWEVVPADSAQGHGVVASGNVSDTTVVASGLTASTAYHAYVQNDCGSGYDGPVTFTTACSATTTFPIVEGFEGGVLPGCWSIENVTGSEDWIYQNGGHYGHPAAAYKGSYNALFYHASSSSPAVTRLVSPPLDLSGATTPYLTFYHAQASWYGDQDELRVYYKTSLGGTWTLLPGAEWTGDIPDWQSEVFMLPNPSGDYYIAFEATGAYGYGVALDNVQIGYAAPVPLSDWAIYIGIFFILTFLVIGYKRKFA